VLPLAVTRVPAGEVGSELIDRRWSRGLPGQVVAQTAGGRLVEVDRRVDEEVGASELGIEHRDPNGDGPTE